MNYASLNQVHFHADFEGVGIGGLGNSSPSEESNRVRGAIRKKIENVP